MVLALLGVAIWPIDAGIPAKAAAFNHTTNDGTLRKGAYPQGKAGPQGKPGAWARGRAQEKDDVDDDDEDDDDGRDNWQKLWGKQRTKPKDSSKASAKSSHKEPPNHFSKTSKDSLKASQKDPPKPAAPPKAPPRKPAPKDASATSAPGPGTHPDTPRSPSGPAPDAPKAHPKDPKASPAEPPKDPKADPNAAKEPPKGCPAPDAPSDAPGGAKPEAKCKAPPKARARLSLTSSGTWDKAIGVVVGTLGLLALLRNLWGGGRRPRARPEPEAATAPQAAAPPAAGSGAAEAPSRGPSEGASHAPEQDRVPEGHEDVRRGEAPQQDLPQPRSDGVQSRTGEHAAGLEPGPAAWQSNGPHPTQPPQIWVSDPSRLGPWGAGPARRGSDTPLAPGSEGTTARHMFRTESPTLLSRTQSPVVLSRTESPVVLSRTESPVVLSRTESPTLLQQRQLAETEAAMAERVEVMQGRIAHFEEQLRDSNARYEALAQVLEKDPLSRRGSDVSRKQQMEAKLAAELQKERAMRLMYARMLEKSQSERTASAGLRPRALQSPAQPEGGGDCGV